MADNDEASSWKGAARGRVRQAALIVSGGGAAAGGASLLMGHLTPYTAGGVIAASVILGLAHCKPVLIWIAGREHRKAFSVHHRQKRKDLRIVQKLSGITEAERTALYKQVLTSAPEPSLELSVPAIPEDHSGGDALARATRRAKWTFKPAIELAPPKAQPPAPPRRVEPS